MEKISTATVMTQMAYSISLHLHHVFDMIREWNSMCVCMCICICTYTRALRPQMNSDQ